MMQAPIKNGVVSSPYPPVELPQDETLYQLIKKRFLEYGDKLALILFSIDRTPNFVCIQDFEREDGGQFKAPRIQDPKNHIILHAYTSGTTGLPKGVEVSMSALIASVELSRASELFKDRDVVLGWNPMMHACGFITPMTAFLCGAMVIPSTAGLSPKEFVEIVQKHKVFKLESLRNAYGFTEAAGFLCIPAPNTIGYRSVGHAVPMVEYKIIDNASGRQLGPYEVGEITFRAPYHMKGYYKRPDETAEVLDDERWLRSGDAGYYDSSGQLYLVERLKDMIKCLDQQLAPAEIETLLTQHPRVLEAAVVGIDNPEFGEAPTAFVVIEPSARGGVTEEELVRLVSEKHLQEEATNACSRLSPQRPLRLTLFGEGIFAEVPRKPRQAPAHQGIHVLDPVGVPAPATKALSLGPKFCVHPKPDKPIAEHGEFDMAGGVAPKIIVRVFNT
ncbi:hypothetical protein MTO96_002422 [Rhipicephalus appendiculatus]